MRFWATEPTPGEIKVRHISSLGVVYFSKMYFMIFGIRLWESHKKNWGFQRSDGGLTQDIASFQPVSVSTRESIPMSSHALLLLEILLNLSFFFFEILSEVTNFCKDWLKVPVLTKLAWPFNFTEWRPVDYLCLEGTVAACVDMWPVGTLVPTAGAIQDHG